MAAVDDSFTVAADQLLVTNVTYNDAGVTPLSSFGYLVVKAATYTTPSSTAAVQVPAGFQFTQQGQVLFSPAAAGKLRVGTVVTFVYAIQPLRSGAARSNNATVTITITDPGVWLVGTRPTKASSAVWCCACVDNVGGAEWSGGPHAAWAPGHVCKPHS
jgi:hypothetical protein